MFKVVVHFDGHLYTDTRSSYVEALASFAALNKVALKLQITGIINEYYVDLVKEADK